MESSSRPLRQAERENTCFKDVGRRVMKAGHNEAERPCSYLQSIWGAGGGGDLVACHHKETLINWQRRNKAGTKQMTGRSEVNSQTGKNLLFEGGKSVGKVFFFFFESKVSVLNLRCLIMSLMLLVVSSLLVFTRQLQILQMWPFLSYQLFLVDLKEKWEWRQSNTFRLITEQDSFCFTFIDAMVIILFL